jgi:hypothetical protein
MDESQNQNIEPETTELPTQAETYALDNAGQVSEPQAD